MNAPSLVTIKRLFALSGNRCAYPNCTIPIVEESGTVTGIVCHIKAQSIGGPRYDPSQVAEERHGFGNLLLMCARHSKVIDGEPSTYTVERLQEMKAIHDRGGSIELSRAQAAMAEALWHSCCTVNISAGGHVMVGSPGGIQGSSITINASNPRFKVLPAQGTLGSDGLRRNYIKHLIDRYNEFASKQPGRANFTFAAIYSHIKRRYRADWDRTLLSQFDEISTMLQGRIDRTRLGSINRGKGISNYSSFDEYRRKCAGEV